MALAFRCVFRTFLCKLCIVCKACKNAWLCVRSGPSRSIEELCRVNARCVSPKIMENPEETKFMNLPKIFYDGRNGWTAYVGQVVQTCLRSEPRGSEAEIAFGLYRSSQEKIYVGVIPLCCAIFSW